MSERAAVCAAPSTRTRKDPGVRFWSYVDRSGGADACWPWMGGRGDHGYCTFYVGLVDGRHVTCGAHRYALELALGRPLAPGMQARHVVCDNPPCVNPSHLAEGTQSANMQDMLGKLRHGAITQPDRVPRGDRAGSRTRPESRPRGEGHANARLTLSDVVMLHAFTRAGYSARSTGKAMGINPATAQRIVSGRAWSHALPVVARVFA